MTRASVKHGIIGGNFTFSEVDSEAILESN